VEGGRRAGCSLVGRGHVIDVLDTRTRRPLNNTSTVARVKRASTCSWTSGANEMWHIDNRVLPHSAFRSPDT
jgi:hypothetical protein